MTTSEMLALFSPDGETRCDVFCLSDSIAVSVGKGWIHYDDLRRLVKEGLITIRLEEVWCPPMGERMPPIRHCTLTDAGRALLATR